MAVHDMLMAAAGGTAGAVNYIDDVFSTYLYTGNGSTQTITNGIDLAGKGGMVWTKGRSFAAASFANAVIDTVRGGNKALATEMTNYENTYSGYITSFNANGYALGTSNNMNLNGGTTVSWTFRKQAKFFDIVTYTGNGVVNRSISHSLGSVPGCIIIKATSSTQDWCVWHIKSGITNSAQGLSLNQSFPATYPSNDVTGQITSTSFNLEWITDYAGNAPNSNGVTYVAYVFGNNAGGFGTSGTDNVISCGSYTGNGSATGPTITLGYEPQWLLIKRVSEGSDTSWFVFDSMRGMPVDAGDLALYPNLSNTEFSLTCVKPLATGFQITSTSDSFNTNNATYIYIAIRRPMKPPTTGTEVFQPTYSYNPTLDTVVTTNFPQDLIIAKKTQFGDSGNTDAYWNWQNRLTGYAPDAYTSPATLFSNSTDSQSSSIAPAYYKITNNKSTIGSFVSGWENIIYNFKRASGFFDIVCYTGTSPTPQNISHNLGVAPQMMIVKIRSVSGDNWAVYHSALGNEAFLTLNTINAVDYNGDLWDVTTPTATTFRVGQANLANYGGRQLVAYLFATLPGVSKVGSYTGNGGQGKVIDCGFSSGARFVLIKRTDSNGFGNSNWYVWDTARGIVSGNDDGLRLNTQQISFSGSDDIDPHSSGFIVNHDNFDININGASYIYLAIA